MAATLFDFAIDTNSAREAQRLRAVQRDKEAWDSESPNGLAEVFIQQMLDASEMKRRRVTWYVTRRLTEPFVARKLGGAQALKIDDHRAPTAPGVAPAKVVLSALGPRLSALLTANYDLLPEYALGTAGFNYGTVGEQLIGRGKNPWFPWQGDDPCVSGELLIYKLHGSVSWDSFAKRTDGGCGVRGDALIVPPRPEKVAPVELKLVWQMASRALRAARMLVVFGFAFNPSSLASSRYRHDRSGIARHARRELTSGGQSQLPRI